MNHFSALSVMPKPFCASLSGAASGPRGQVGGPVGLGVGGPRDGGVDVDIEQVGEHGGWKVGRQRGEGGAAGAAEVDTQVGAQGAVESIARGSAGEPAGKQPSGVAGTMRVHARDHAGRAGDGYEKAEESTYDVG